MPRKAKAKSAKNTVKAYKKGYEAVNQRVLEEARQTPATLKYRQFLSLWRMGEALGWKSPQEKELKRCGNAGHGCAGFMPANHKSVDALIIRTTSRSRPKKPKKS